MGTCDLLLNSEVIDSTKSLIPKVKSHLFLSGGFTLSESHQSAVETISLVCTPHPQYESEKLFSMPIISGYYSGIASLAIHYFFIVILGPLFSIILLSSLILTNSDTKNRLNINIFQFYLFAISSIFYSLSLSHFTSVVFIKHNLYVHTLLRALFSFSFVYLLESYSSKIKLNFALHIAFVALATLAN
jgi:hypothetical protein